MGTKFFILGLVTINNGNVPLVFLNAPVLKIYLSDNRGSSLGMSVFTFHFFEPQDFANHEYEEQGSGKRADEPAGGLPMEETVESSLEWGERITSLRVAGGLE